MSGPFRWLSDLVHGVARVPAAVDPTEIGDSVLDITDEVAGSTADILDEAVGGIVDMFDL